MDLEKLLLRIPERSGAGGDDEGEYRFSSVLDFCSLPESLTLLALALALALVFTLGSGCGRSGQLGRGGNRNTGAKPRTTGSAVRVRRTGWGE